MISPIINIYSDGLGHFQSYRLRNPHMPQYERLGICLAASCLLGMQLCPKVSCSLLFLFIFILCACFGPLIGLLLLFLQHDLSLCFFCGLLLCSSFPSEHTEMYDFGIQGRKGINLMRVEQNKNLFLCYYYYY